MFARKRMNRFGGKRKKYGERSTEGVIIDNEFIQGSDYNDPDKIIIVIPDGKTGEGRQDGGTTEEVGREQAATDASVPQPLGGGGKETQTTDEGQKDGQKDGQG